MDSQPIYHSHLFVEARQVPNTIDEIIRVAGSVPKTVLELYCGTGEHSIELSNRGIKTSMHFGSNKAREHFAKNTMPPADLAKSELTIMAKGEWPTKKADLAFCVNPHLLRQYVRSRENLERFLRKVASRVKEGGSIVLYYDQVEHFMCFPYKAKAHSWKRRRGEVETRIQFSKPSLDYMNSIATMTTEITAKHIRTGEAVSKPLVKEITIGIFGISDIIYCAEKAGLSDPKVYTWENVNTTLCIKDSNATPCIRFTV